MTKAHGVIANVDLDDDDVGIAFVQAAGLSPIVRLSESGAPPRRTPTTMARPTLSAPRPRSSEAMLATGAHPMLR